MFPKLVLDPDVLPEEAVGREFPEVTSLCMCLCSHIIPNLQFKTEYLYLVFETH